VPHPFTHFVKGAQGSHHNHQKHLHLPHQHEGCPRFRFVEPGSWVLWSAGALLPLSLPTKRHRQPLSGSPAAASKHHTFGWLRPHPTCIKVMYSCHLFFRRRGLLAPAHPLPRIGLQPLKTTHKSREGVPLKKPTRPIFLRTNSRMLTSPITPHESGQNAKPSISATKAPMLDRDSIRVCNSSTCILPLHREPRTHVVCQEC
jgi:hypothetical protein